MNLVYGEVVELLKQDDLRTGRVRIAAVLKNVPLELVPDAQAGDTVLICDGIAIGKVRGQLGSSKERVAN